MLTKDDVQYLVSPEGREACRYAATLEGGELAVLEKIRRDLTQQQATAVMQTLKLRRRAALKFDRADEMLFTEESLQQATSQAVAEYRAAAFADASIVLEIGCGTGGDTIALARACKERVIAVDIDEVRLLMARHNVEVYGLADKVEFVQAKAESLLERNDITADAVFIDPSRRVEGRRTLRMTQSEPSIDTAMSLVRRFGRGAIKCAPAADYENAAPDAAVEVISLDGECKEVVLWVGFPQMPAMRATLLPGPVHLVKNEGVKPAEVRLPGQYICDPDPAVVRAHLIKEVAAQFGLWKIDATTAYLCGDEALDTPLLRCERITRWLPFNLKKLNAALSQLDIGRVRIKRRGFPLAPNELKRKLKLKGRTAATLYCCRHSGKHIIIIAGG